MYYIQKNNNIENTLIILSNKTKYKQAIKKGTIQLLLRF